MKTLDEIKGILLQQRNDLRERFGVTRLAIFGSYARGDQTLQSDVDVMVELERPMGWEIVDLHEALQELLGSRVDLTTRLALIRKPRLWKLVERDLTYVDA